MGATNPTTSYVARLRYRLARRPGHPVVSYGGTDMLSDASNNPHRTGIREDGAFIEDQVDATGNSLAMILYSAQPDPIVSQQAIVTTHAGSATEDSTNALVVHQTPYGLRNSALTYAGRAVDNPVQGISFQEDGTMFLVCRNKIAQPRITGFRGANNNTKEEHTLILKFLTPRARQVLTTKMILKTLTLKGEQMLTPKGEQLTTHKILISWKED